MSCLTDSQARRQEYRDGSSESDSDDSLVLKCHNADPGQHVVSVPTGEIAWEEDGVLKKCVDNTIAPEPAASRCVPCEEDTYAEDTLDAERRSHYLCKPCGLLGSESKFCPIKWGSLLLLFGVLLALVAIAALTVFAAKKKKADDVVKARMQVRSFAPSKDNHCNGRHDRDVQCFDACMAGGLGRLGCWWTTQMRSLETTTHPMMIKRISACGTSRPCGRLRTSSWA